MNAFREDRNRRYRVCEIAPDGWVKDVSGNEYGSQQPAKDELAVIAKSHSAPDRLRVMAVWTESDIDGRIGIEDIRDRAVITVTEAAELLELDERTVRRGLEDGNLPGVRVGRRWVVPVPRLLRLLEHGAAPTDELPESPQ